MSAPLPRGTRAADSAPWSAASTVATDCTLHQLAPYIGRMKTTIARHLVESYTRKNDLVLDPFCGSGVVPLEASILGRRVIAADLNPYGVVLTRAKLGAPESETAAQRRLKKRWADAVRRLADQDLRSVPKWVRDFFHPNTLRSALALRDELVDRRDWFLLACLLGILHHQRPGFLSYPSSHLVPYLRGRLFPRDSFPDLYEKRDVYSRMEAKVRRAYRRPPQTMSSARVLLRDSRKLVLRETVDAIITSPPYMNELDYVRDNRLRLWLLLRHLPEIGDATRRNREQDFKMLMGRVLTRLAGHLSPRGRVILVVGEASRGSRVLDSAAVIRSIFEKEQSLNHLKLSRVISDRIPDIRRSRRDLRGTKEETVLVFERPPQRPRQRSANATRVAHAQQPA